jgi:hypothetical protein
MVSITTDGNQPCYLVLVSPECREAQPFRFAVRSSEGLTVPVGFTEPGGYLSFNSFYIPLGGLRFGYAPVEMAS